MKPIILTFLFVRLIVPALSQSTFRSESDIKANPLDIADYYLLIPGEPYYNYDKKPAGVSEFELRKKYLNETPTKKITIDKKNAFISIDDNTNDLEYRLEMTYFNKANGKKIIAVLEYQAGGDCDSRSLNFYEYAGQKFTNVTKQILPSVLFKDLFRDPAGEFSYTLLFQLEYKLPRIGTTLEVKALPLCEQDNRSDLTYEEYFKKFQRLEHISVALAWDRASGTFSKK